MPQTIILQSAKNDWKNLWPFCMLTSNKSVNLEKTSRLLVNSIYGPGR